MITSRKCHAIGQRTTTRGGGGSRGFSRHAVDTAYEVQQGTKECVVALLWGTKMNLEISGRR